MPESADKNKYTNNLPISIQTEKVQRMSLRGQRAEIRGQWRTDINTSCCWQRGQKWRNDNKTAL